MLDGQRREAVRETVLCLEVWRDPVKAFLTYHQYIEDRETVEREDAYKGLQKALSASSIELPGDEDLNDAPQDGHRE